MRVTMRLFVRFSAIVASLWLSQACGDGTSDVPDTALSTDPLVEIVPGASPVIPSLGTGWSRVGEKYMGRCVFGSTRRLPRDVGGTLKISSTLDGVAAQRQMGFDLGSRAYFGIASASLKAQAASSMNQDAFSRVWVFSANYVADAEELDFNAATPLTVIGQAAKQKSGWLNECGDEVVYQIQRGAQLYIVYRLDFKTENIKKDWEGALNGHYNVLEVNSAVKKLATNQGQHAQLTIEVYQFGGDPTRVTGIVTGPASNLSEAEMGARAVVQCGIDKLDACEDFLTRAMVYATSLQAPDAFPQQAHNHASPTLYVTMPWSRLGHPALQLPQDEDLDDARLKLSLAFSQVMAARKRVATLLDSTWVDEAQRRELDAWDIRLAASMAHVNRAIKACYDDITINTRVTPARFDMLGLQRCRRVVEQMQKVAAMPPDAVVSTGLQRSLINHWRALHPGVPDAFTLPAMQVGQTSCIISDTDAVCGDEHSERANAYAMPRSIFESWKQLVNAGYGDEATKPMSNARTDGSGVYVAFAPRAAIYAPSDSAPVLLFGEVLEYWRQHGGARILGFPMAHQILLQLGESSYASFQNATSVVCRQGDKCVSMDSRVLQTWLDQGGPTGCLKYPKRHRMGDAVTCFYGGLISFDPHADGVPYVKCPASWYECLW